MNKTLLALAALVATATAVAQTTAVGPLRIVDPWTRAMPAPRDVTGVFMTLQNTGTTDDVLLGGSSPVAARVEIHATTTGADGVARMRQLQEGLAVPAKGSVALQHGGHHIMLFGLKAPTQEGATLPLTLRFRNAGEVVLQVPVKPVGHLPPVAAPGHGAHHGHH